MYIEDDLIEERLLYFVFSNILENIT